MASKKKLKRRNRRLNKENEQLAEDYHSLGAEYIDGVVLYHDIIKLFAEYDGELLLRSFRAADLERLQEYKQEIERLNIKVAKLKHENEQLKAPKVTAWLNDEQIEILPTKN